MTRSPADLRIGRISGIGGTGRTSNIELTPNSPALHVAAWRAQHEVVRTLIASGTPVNARDARSRTALQLAVKACIDSYWKHRRRPDSVAALLDAGGVVDGIDLPTGYDDIDELLLAHKIRPYI